MTGLNISGWRWFDICDLLRDDSRDDEPLACAMGADGGVRLRVGVDVPGPRAAGTADAVGGAYGDERGFAVGEGADAAWD
jgi:hypothetical protein